MLKATSAEIGKIYTLVDSVRAPLLLKATSVEIGKIYTLVDSVRAPSVVLRISHST